MGLFAPASIDRFSSSSPEISSSGHPMACAATSRMMASLARFGRK